MTRVQHLAKIRPTNNEWAFYGMFGILLLSTILELFVGGPPKNINYAFIPVLSLVGFGLLFIAKRFTYKENKKSIILYMLASAALAGTSALSHLWLGVIRAVLYTIYAIVIDIKWEQYTHSVDRSKMPWHQVIVLISLMAAITAAIVIPLRSVESGWLHDELPIMDTMTTVVFATSISLTLFMRREAPFLKWLSYLMLAIMYFMIGKWTSAVGSVLVVVIYTFSTLRWWLKSKHLYPHVHHEIKSFDEKSYKDHLNEIIKEKENEHW